MQAAHTSHQGDQLFCVRVVPRQVSFAWIIRLCNLSSTFWGFKHFFQTSCTLSSTSYLAREAWDMYAKLRNWNVPQATIRVHFPDGFVVEATFKSTETISDVMELVRKAITRPDLPFYLCTNLNLVLLFLKQTHHFISIPMPWDVTFFVGLSCVNPFWYQSVNFKRLLPCSCRTDVLMELILVLCADTTPPKKPLRDLQQNMINASFCPGANVHFSFNPSQGDEFLIRQFSMFKPQHCHGFLQMNDKHTK